MFRRFILTAAAAVALASPAVAQYRPAEPSPGYVCRIIQDTASGRMDLTARIDRQDKLSEYTVRWRPPGASADFAWRGIEDVALSDPPIAPSGAPGPAPAALAKARTELAPLKVELDELIEQHRNRCPLATADR